MINGLRAGYVGNVVCLGAVESAVVGLSLAEFDIPAKPGAMKYKCCVP